MIFLSRTRNNLILQDLLMQAHLKDKQDSENNIGAYIATLNLLKDSIAEFGHSDVEFASLFKTEKLLAPVNSELEEIDLLNDGHISEPEHGYIYKKKNLEKKEFFRPGQNHLVHTNVLQKIIAKTTKSDASEQIKQELIKQLSWWIEVRN
ncbi:unnamed protein product [Lactuca virosa]|uniref:Uncharacterized protein n=1 Tax=Lactuca virosa TaxID=75947 RepID=A0AAU9MWZ5_9ASTR|nr:unnamed protein product [Lactuca virosa]